MFTAIQILQSPRLHQDDADGNIAKKVSYTRTSSQLLLTLDAQAPQS